MEDSQELFDFADLVSALRMAGWEGDEADIMNFAQAEGALDENGMPTQWALDNGLMVLVDENGNVIEGESK